MRTLEEAEHTTPTPIQEQAIPVVIDGNDVVGLAQTGTGKTAAFLLPLIHNQERPNHKGKYRPIRVLILSPTRELAAQIAEKARLFGKSMNLRSQLTVGGVHINKQMQQLSRGADILIATPGRLLDLAKRDAIQLDKVEALVLDEADHMLDIGFLPDVKRIIGQLPKERQTLLFSATMPKAIQDLAAQYLKDPVEISVARQSSVAENIDQSVKHINGGLKPDALATLLHEHSETRTVVFARTKHGADNIVRRLSSEDIEARAIHGNKSQGQRERALKAFTRGDYNVLVATDIAARGIDIKDVGLVVNYELPDVPEVYVHRIGRTARAGATGKAVSFCTSTEVNQLRGIERLIQMSIPAEGKIEKPAGGSKNKGKAKPKNKPNRPGSKARKKPDFKPRGEFKKNASELDDHVSAKPAARREEASGKKSYKKRRDRQSDSSYGERDSGKNPGNERPGNDRSERKEDGKRPFKKRRKSSDHDGPWAFQKRFDGASNERSEESRGKHKKSSFKPTYDERDDREQRNRKPRTDSKQQGEQSEYRDSRNETKSGKRGNKPYRNKSEQDKERPDRERPDRERQNKGRGKRAGNESRQGNRSDQRGGEKPRSSGQKTDQPRSNRSSGKNNERFSSSGDRPRFRKSGASKSNHGGKTPATRGNRS